MSKSAIYQERLMQVLLAPLQSEKTTLVGEKSNQVVFKVVSDANKTEIKDAVELLFKVKVNSVQILNVKGKQKNFGQIRGQRSGWKKAYVALKKGEDLSFANA
jgi:large subunit ribosomal protein L23